MRKRRVEFSAAIGLTRRIMRQPDMPEDDAQVLLIEATYYPFVSPLELARQLRNLREAQDRGHSICTVCRKEYQQPKPKPNIGGECNDGNCPERRISRDHVRRMADKM